jgi:hypothetical protein
MWDLGSRICWQGILLHPLLSSGTRRSSPAPIAPSGFIRDVDPSAILAIRRTNIGGSGLQGRVSFCHGSELESVKIGFGY